MEVCIPGSKTCLSDPTNFNSGDPLVNGLKTCLNEFPSIEDATISSTDLKVSSVKSNKGGNIKSSHSATGKHFNNRVGFMALSKSKSSVDDGKTQEDAEAFNSSSLKCCSKPVEQGHSRPLVSAMKGSREKQGKAIKKASVTWAPDVYDPIPTSVSHVPSNKNQRKKHGKKKNNKQKGNGKSSSRGSKGKDKKQSQKVNIVVGSPPEKLPSLKDGDEENDDENFEDVKIVVAETFCGSSFLKKSITNLQHFPVTEAK